MIIARCNSPSYWLTCRWATEVHFTSFLSQFKFGGYFAIFISIAVVSCAKFCNIHFLIIEQRAKRNFHRIWITMGKPLVEWAPGSVPILGVWEITYCVITRLYCTFFRCGGNNGIRSTYTHVFFHPGATPLLKMGTYGPNQPISLWRRSSRTCVLKIVKMTKLQSSWQVIRE